MGSLISSERFFNRYKEANGSLPNTYYQDTKLVVHGMTPDMGSMTYFLAAGDVIAEEQWKQITYHIPTILRDEAQEHVQALFNNFIFQTRPRRGRNGNILGSHVTVFGSYTDARGRPVVEATMGPAGELQRVNYKRRAVPRGYRVPDNSYCQQEPEPERKNNIIFLPLKNQGEPVMV